MSPYTVIYYLKGPRNLALQGNVPIAPRPNDAVRDLFEGVPPTKLDYAQLQTELCNGLGFIQYLKANFEDELNSIWKFSDYTNLPNAGTKFQMSEILEDWTTRLASIKGDAIGSICLFGTPYNFSISGILICRGSNCAIDRLPDLPNPREDFLNWEKLEIDNDATETLIDNYFLKFEFTEENKPYRFNRFFV